MIRKIPLLFFLVAVISCFFSKDQDVSGNLSSLCVEQELLGYVSMDEEEVVGIAANKLMLPKKPWGSSERPSTLSEKSNKRIQEPVAWYKGVAFMKPGRHPSIRSNKYVPAFSSRPAYLAFHSLTI